jgi:cytochrome c553
MPIRPRVRGIVAAVTASAALAAGSAGVVAAGADMEFGRYLATECMTCHRAATATSTIPNIFGLNETHFTEVIKAYRARTLPNAVMQNIAGRLSDDEIASLALYFSRTNKP